MAVKHSHPVHRTEGSTHVDSSGTYFGKEEHEAAASKVDKWPEDKDLLDVPHVHRKLDVSQHPDSGIDVWKVTSKSGDEEVVDESARDRRPAREAGSA